jgi:hypothetical protein
MTQTLTDLMVYLGWNPHPTGAQVIVISVSGVVVVWVLLVCLERVLDL